MLDLATLVALALGLYASLRRRFYFGALVAIVLALTTSIEAIAVLRAPDVTGELAASMLFLGPSALIATLPLAHEAAYVALSFAVFYVAARTAWRLRPESDEARAWDAASRPFLVVAVVRAVVAVGGAAITFFLRQVLH